MSVRDCVLAILLVATPACAMAQVSPEVQARMAAQDWAGAEVQLRARLAEAPGDDAARFQLARVLAWQQRAAEALPLYDSLLAREPANADYLFGRAQALLWSGDVAEAEASLTRLEATAPNHPGLVELRRQAVAAKATHTASTRIEPPVRREFGYALRHEWLTQGLDAWHGDRIDVTHRGARGHGWHLAASRERRFGADDSGVEGGVALPVGPRWTLQVEGGGWPGSEVQPRWFGDVRMQRAFDAGTVLGASLRRTRYADATVERLALAAEQYVGDWRVAYTFNRTDVDGRRVNGHDVTIDRYYGDRDVVGVRLTAGNEDALQQTGVVTSAVRALAVQGRHGLSPLWSLQWGAGYARQGDLYDRRWLQFGVRRAF